MELAYDYHQDSVPGKMAHVSYVEGYDSTSLLQPGSKTCGRLPLLLSLILTYGQWSHCRSFGKKYGSLEMLLYLGMKIIAPLSPLATYVWTLIIGLRDLNLAGLSLLTDLRGLVISL